MGHGLGDGTVYGRVTEESKEQRAESESREQSGCVFALCLLPFAFCLLPFAFCSLLFCSLLSMEISPGAHHLPRYLPLDRQRELADRLRGLIDGAVPAYVPVVRGGGKMHVRMLCLGRHWNAKTYQYEPVRSDFDAQPAPPLPADLQQLAREIAAAAGMTIDPDLCIVNYYAADGKMGLHQDKDEGPASIAAGIPVVSLSVGDTARFLFGGLKRRDPIDVVALESGDAFVFGGPSRLRYHGVSRITPGTAPAELRNGRPVQSHLPAVRRHMPRVVVVGAGAAGLMASIFAAADGADTTLVERTRDGGRKILISGGGRCNILPSELEESRFVTDSSPNTLRKIVRSWPLRQQIAFFERDLHLPLVEEPESRKLFPQSQRARDVRDMLMEHARGKGVVIVTDSFVTDVTPDADRWLVQREGAEAIGCDAVILATGGLSVPTTGSDGHGLEIARRLGHSVHATYPALTPLLNDSFSSLAGVSLPVTLTARSTAREARATGGFLFTHRGYSGPAVLDVSHVPVRSLIETGLAG